MPNVGFKMGTQDSLNALLKLGTNAGAANGTFYLTSNTNRLYIGKADGSIAPVNAGIITVDRVSPQTGDPNTYTYLPTSGSKDVVGNYYYATQDNILCVYNGQQWVQINSVVTNDDMTTEVSAVTGGAQVTSTVTQTAGKEVTDSFKITGEKGVVVTADADNDVIKLSADQITVAATAGQKDATVTLTSDLLTNGSQAFKIVGGTNVDSIGVSGNNITINVKDTTNESLTNSLSTSNGKVTVSTTVSPSEGQEVSGSYSVTGTNGISVASNTAGDTLTITADLVEVGVGAVTNGAAVSLASDLVDSTKKDFNIVSGNENVTVSVDGKNVKISTVDKDTKIDKIEATALNAGYSITATPNVGEELTTSFDPVISFGKTGAKSDVHFVNNVASLDVYTTSQTDALIASELKLFNAMMYKGTIPSGGSLPTSNIAIGDTYLIGSDGFTHNGTTYPAGTMAIARPANDSVKEDSNGFIPAGSVVWDFVTGSQVDTLYGFDALTNGIQLTANGTSAAGSLTVNGDNKDITVSSSKSSGKDQVLTVSHKTYAGTNTPSNATAMTNKQSSYNIVAIDSLTLENGHISGYTTKTYTVTDTNANLTNYSAKVAGITDVNGVSVSQSVTLTPSAGEEETKTAAFSIKSLNDNLKVAAESAAATNAGITINLEWGTF